MNTTLLETDLPRVPLVGRGKVRDIYAIGDDQLLLVTSDRISAFDCVLGSGIPDKGRVLNQISLFWFDFFRETVPNHLITADVAAYPHILQTHRDQLEGRSMLVRKAKMIEVECVARGYLSGSGWKEYKASQEVCGVKLPAGLRESDRLPEAIFTPAIKAHTGHDENVSFDRVAELIGTELAGRLREITLTLYSKAAAYAETRGILIADTKFEFGFVDGVLVLGDEALTPDSSRFWPKSTYAPGGAQPSYDKQYVRDYLETLAWNKQYPAPALPADVVERTAEKYREAYRELTGKTL
jgi:phosphoribosylaminoimidazole-succinocarboxamide synthase